MHVTDVGYKKSTNFGTCTLEGVFFLRLRMQLSDNFYLNYLMPKPTEIMLALAKKPLPQRTLITLQFKSMCTSRHRAASYY